DETRTFLAGGSKTSADEKQKQLYTTVLKGFLNGLNFEPNENTTGFDLDSSVREIIDANKPEGFNFSHATGHGIGIPVHESPPKIGPSKVETTSLKPNMCFTIEPGLYQENFGGVRIENTVTITEKNNKKKIKTLTRAALDENLINYNLLTDKEKKWLKEYQDFKIG
ncbi:MAG: M24 family metallopeptidase, partial [Candidatus Aenigmarchaeota archaeon]|nr:M24 family metallopeptidase [Candidatus Aenigmarchaeota archaeon]